MGALCRYRGGHAVVAAIMERALEFLPSLRGFRQGDIAPRVGLRPYCRQGRPLLGPAPGCPGLWVAAGHEGSGLTLAPASADVLARQLLSLPSACDCSAFLPERLLPPGS